MKIFKGNIAGRAWTYISIISVFFSVGVVMFHVDGLPPIGLVAAGGIMQTVGALSLFLGLKRNYLFLGQQGSFCLDGHS